MKENENQLIFLKEGWNEKECKQRWISNDNINSIIQELKDVKLFINKSFSFVGIYTCQYESNQGYIIIGYPKYIISNSEEEIINHMYLVCKVIEITVNNDSDILIKGQEFRENSSKVKYKSVELINLADFIIRDYLENGIYNLKVKTTKKNGRGNILWSKTISKISPIIERDTAIYTTTINRSKKNDFSQTITDLHCYIINKCYYNILKPLGRYSSIVMPECITYIGNNLTEYSSIIFKHISQVYSQRELTLLKALYSWCNLSCYYDRIIIGVNCFNKVWEYTTKSVFGNIDNTKSDQARYIINNKKYKVKGDANPDILNAFKYNDKNCIAILDAKYYFPKKINDSKNESEGYIEGLPANSEIVKQVDYYNSIRQRYTNIECKYSNSFLLPEFTSKYEMCTDKLDGRLYRYIGRAMRSTPPRIDPILQKLEQENYVFVRKDKDDELDFVLLYEIDPEVLYKSVLENKKVSKKDIYNDFILPFNNNNEI